MHVGVTGSHGLIGSLLVRCLTHTGHEVKRLPRPNSKIRAELLEGLDAVVHLAGENIAGRWTAQKKKRIRESRVQGTRRLSETLQKINQPPKIFLSASAIGYYGSQRDEALTENSSLGEGFLAEVCRDWEEATIAVQERGLRVVHLRIGVVMSARGGALQKMLLPFKLGLGGVIGDGQQWWSWISIDDVIGAIIHILKTENLHGPVNVVSPQAVTNYEFTKTLGRVLKRPTVFPMPKFAARLAFGEMADETLLCNSRVQPARLEGTGYKFQFPDITEALNHLL